MTPLMRQVGGVGALAFWLAVTAGWWALALWPVAGATPEWLARARLVCFNASDSGLPDASGWLLLIGQPIGLLAVLMVLWGASVRDGLRALAAVPVGRGALALIGASLVLGLGAAGARVVSASDGSPPTAVAELPPDSYPRLDLEAPPLSLVDQAGDEFRLADLFGHPVLVTFAFGHCETVCPMVVRDALEVQRRAETRVSVVVVTLDPWRDTPPRLPHLAEHWGAGDDVYVLSGPVVDVNAVLDHWNVARRRDPDTGDVTHPPLTYVLDAAGRIAYGSTGGAAALAALLDRS